MNFSNSRAAVWHVEHSYMSYSFRIMHVGEEKMEQTNKQTNKKDGTNTKIRLRFL